MIEERQQANEMRQQATAAAQLEEAKRHNEEMFESEMARLEQVWVEQRGLSLI